MKITLEVNDINKASTLIEFLKSLAYVNIKAPKTTQAPIPDWHIAVLQQRMNSFKANPKEVIDFDKAIDDIEKEL
ncbi:MAG: addiction module protein [Bacteroidetes bacterium]|nr:addiction module protein [Bacteroidota bacterium]